MKKYLGALLGGLIASIPWIVLDFIGYVWALLTIPIALGVEKGYMMAGGTRDSKTPVIVTVLTLLIVISLSAYIMPFLYVLINHGVLVTPMQVYELFKMDNFSSISSHMFTSVLFALLGLSGVIKGMKNKENEEVPEAALEQ